MLSSLKVSFSQWLESNSRHYLIASAECGRSFPSTNESYCGPRLIVLVFKRLSIKILLCAKRSKRGEIREPKSCCTLIFDKIRQSSCYSVAVFVYKELIKLGQRNFEGKAEITLLVSCSKPMNINAFSKADLLEAELTTDYRVYGEYLRAYEAKPLSKSSPVSLKWVHNDWIIVIDTYLSSSEIKQ